MADAATVEFAARFFKKDPPSPQQVLIAESLLRQPTLMLDPNADRTDQMAMLAAHRALVERPIRLVGSGRSGKAVDDLAANLAITRRAQEIVAELASLK